MYNLTLIQLFIIGKVNFYIGKNKMVAMRSHFYTIVAFINETAKFFSPPGGQDAKLTY
jgi:hypothetical protein